MTDKYIFQYSEHCKCENCLEVWWYITSAWKFNKYSGELLWKKSAENLYQKLVSEHIFNFSKKPMHARSYLYLKTFKKSTWFFLLHPVTLYGQDYGKQKGPGTRSLGCKTCLERFLFCRYIIWAILIIKHKVVSQLL